METAKKFLQKQLSLLERDLEHEKEERNNLENNLNSCEYRISVLREQIESVTEAIIKLN